MNPAQCRAARLLAGLSIVDLAAAASVPLASVCDFESAIAPPVRSPADVAAMKAALDRRRVQREGGEVGSEVAALTPAQCLAARALLGWSQATISVAR